MISFTSSGLPDNVFSSWLLVNGSWLGIRLGFVRFPFVSDWVFFGLPPSFAFCPLVEHFSE